MTVSDREKVVRLLERSQQQFLETVADLGQTQWAYRSTQDCWSVGEVAAHLLLMETLVMDAIQQVLANPPDPAWQRHTAGRTEMLETALPDRSQRVHAPDELLPRNVSSHAEALTNYKQARARTLAFACETDAPLHTYTLHNPFFGMLSAYQWLLYIALHNLRHNQQIQEIRNDPGFPT